MKLAIMQPYFFPYIGYFQLINAVDRFVVFDDVNYINKGWINRNRILLNKQEYLFTIPLEKASQNKLINEINIATDTEWKGKLLKTIETAYKKAPMFDKAFPLIDETINFKERNLSVYLCNSIEKICKNLAIKTKIIKSSVPYNTRLLKGQDKIIDICIKEKASGYINPIGGKEIYERERFNQQQIKLSFISSKQITYKQFSNDFIPWLSIIDVLMFNDNDTIRTYLDLCSLI